MKRAICLALCLVLMLAMTACDSKGVVGKWHAEATLDDLEKFGIPDEFRAVTFLTGDKLFDIYAQFNEDGTFTYDLDTTELERNLSQNVGTLFNLLAGLGAAELVKGLIAHGFGFAADTMKLSYAGVYSIDKNGIITATDGETFYFTLSSDILHETDQSGHEHFVFTRVTGEE